MTDKPYATIRDLDFLGPVLGQRLLEITQHDPEEWRASGRAYVMLHFENGVSLRFWIEEAGFDVLPVDGEERSGGI